MGHTMYSKGRASFTRLLRPSRRVEPALRNWQRGMSARAEAHGSGPAFTLLELLVVLIVMGVVASIAVPRYADSIARWRVEAAAGRIVADLSLARRHARSAGAEQTVLFSVSTDTYTLDGVRDPDGSDSNYTVSLAQEPYLATIVSADFGGDAGVVFDVYGMADSNGTAVVWVGKYSKTITVEGTTGRATVGGLQVADDD